MKKFLLFLFIVDFSTILLSQTYKVKAGSSLHLMSELNTGSTLIASLTNSAKANVIDKSKGEFWNIKHKDRADSVSSKFILDETKKQKINKPEDNSGKCFDENTHLLNIGIGFRTGYYPNYSGYNYIYGLTPVISISYEQAFKKKLGPGYLGVGGFFAFQSEFQRYDYYDSYYASNTLYYNQYNWNYFMIAARGAYHLDFLMNNKAEVYAGVLLGVRINTYIYSTNYPNNSKYDYYYNQGTVYPAYQVFAGARYYFIKPLAVYAELGYGIYFGTIGLNLKF